MTVQGKPADRSFTVDGTTYTASQTFTWIAGAQHTIATTSPQVIDADSRYAWANWSDGGLISHVVAPTAGQTYTTKFNKSGMLLTPHKPEKSRITAEEGRISAE